MKANPPKATCWKPTPMPRVGVLIAAGRCIRKWQPGTQALREIRHYQRTTELCIPRLPFVCKYFICNVIGTYVGDAGDTCTQCNAVNGTHVRDIGDTCM